MPATSTQGDLYIVGDFGTQPVPAELQGVPQGHAVVADGSGGWTDAGQIQGPVGDTGPTGAQGTLGPVGPLGPTGPQGLQGNTGADGTSISIAGSVANAAALPTQSTAGDMFITSDGHGHVSDGGSPATYKDVGQIQGPAGPAGQLGPVGPTGASGASGASGAVGPTGPDGPTGAQGPTVVSADAGNQATLSANDNFIFVPTPFPSAGAGTAGRVLTAPASGSPLSWVAPSPTAQVTVSGTAGETATRAGSHRHPDAERWRCVHQHRWTG